MHLWIKNKTSWNTPCFVLSFCWQTHSCYPLKQKLLILKKENGGSSDRVAQVDQSDQWYLDLSQSVINGNEIEFPVYFHSDDIVNAWIFLFGLINWIFLWFYNKSYSLFTGLFILQYRWFYLKIYFNSLNYNRNDTVGDAEVYINGWTICVVVIWTQSMPTYLMAILVV